MFRKLIVYTILLSMTLHCACRVGFLDKIYQKRHEIAYTIGLMAELPISLCSSNYNFDKHLNVDAQADELSKFQSRIQTSEINLFFVSVYKLPIARGVILFTASLTWHNNLYALSIVNSIFHPPSLLG